MSGRFYDQRAWKQLRLLKLSVDPLCQYGGPDCTRIATEVDHRVSLKAGGEPLDMQNLASTCRRCHTDKTNREDGGNRGPRRHGIDPKSGTPLDPAHWWNSQENCSQLRADHRAPTARRNFGGA